MAAEPKTAETTDLAPKSDQRIRTYQLPARVEAGWEGEFFKLEDLANNEDIVILGTHGEPFNPGKGMCVRMIWQWAKEYPRTGPDRTNAICSLASLDSVPGREAVRVQKEGKPATARVVVRHSERSGNDYYALE